MFTHTRLELSYDIVPLDKVLDLIVDVSSYGKHSPIPKEYVTKEFTDWLKQYEARVVFAELFYRICDFDYIHADGQEFDQRAKINQIFYNTNSIMEWFLPKDGVGLQPTSMNTIGTGEMKFNRDQLDLIDSALLTD